MPFSLREAPVRSPRWNFKFLDEGLAKQAFEALASKLGEKTTVLIQINETDRAAVRMDGVLAVRFMDHKGSEKANLVIGELNESQEKLLADRRASGKVGFAKG
ncbi:MAG TPA: hypothetical protein VLX09_25835 [Stellaceae bacterium]|nr:hypothetical protein [Stellaceae bacterium]